MRAVRLSCVIDWRPEAVRQALALPEGSPVPEAARVAHTQFAPWLRSAMLDGKAGGVLAVWLEQAVEHVLAESWERSPEQALWLHGVAQTLCMRAVALHVPALVGHGCAPVVPGTSALALALENAGLPCETGAGYLAPRRQYAVVTPVPFRGCSACALTVSCTRRQEPPGHPGGRGNGKYAPR